MLNWLKQKISVGNTNLANKDAWLKQELSALKSGTRLLDAGAGETKYRTFCSHLEYKSQDFGQYDGKGNQEGLQTKTWDQTKLDYVCDIASIPVPDASFDTILCVEVFEHIPNPVEALREFQRILKPGGTLLLTAPFCAMTHFAPYFFVTGYSKYWYEHFLKQSGFVLESITPNGDYFDYLAQELRHLHRITSHYGAVSKLLFLVIKCCVIPCLFLLQYLKNHTKRSSELLCFGMFVRAKKA